MRLTPQQNAQKYFKQYNKAKTAEEVLTQQIEQGRAELDYLESVLVSLGEAESERDLAQLRELPPTDLLLSCATLPFVPRPDFGALWSRMREALRPRGILAVDLFGDRDEWADTDGTYLSRADVEALLDGLEIVELTEEERDGRSFSGPKHWHTFRVIARAR